MLFQPVYSEQFNSNVQPTPLIAVDLRGVDVLQLDKVLDTFPLLTYNLFFEQFANKNICANSDEQCDTDITKSSFSLFIDIALNNYMFSL